MRKETKDYTGSGKCAIRLVRVTRVYSHRVYVGVTNGSRDGTCPKSLV
jgi:hypothetical protein